MTLTPEEAARIQLRDSWRSYRIAESAVADAELQRQKKRKQFGAVVRVARQNLEISLTDLAAQFGVSKSFLSDFEKGRRWSDTLAEDIVTLLGASK